jgi:hypothetical protein
MIRIGLLAGLVLASGVAALNPESLDWKIGGYFDAGRFQMTDSTANGELLHRMGALWNIDYKIDDNWTMDADLHWFFWRNQLHDLGLFHVVGLKFDADMRGVLQYSSGSQLAKFGVYDFKYNPDSKNLGEYLLRSTAYPTLLESSQGKDLLAYSYSRVAGVEYGLNHDLWRAKALIYAEQFNLPVNDVTPAFFVAAGPKYAEVEIGVALDRFWMFGKRMQAKSLDTALQSYIRSQGLTFKATKVSIRGRLDIGEMTGMENGLRLYAETAILGLKNDTLYYKNMSERMPMMVGMDIPTFGILNTLSIEAEYLKNPYYDRHYPNNDANAQTFSPLPALNNSEYSAGNLPNFTKNDWRWSFFAKRSLNQWLDLEGRVASDHMRLYFYNGDYGSGEPFTQKTKDWYFLFRISYHN